MKYFAYDTNGYVAEGWIDDADVATTPQRAALLATLAPADLLRLIYTNGGGDSYANDYDVNGNPAD